MPARIKLSRDQIEGALKSSGGSVGVAAKKLGISAKTLRRRLTEDPTLKPKLSIHDVLHPSIKVPVAGSPGTYEIHTYEHWRPDRTELLPRVLTDSERQDLARKVREKIAREWLGRGLSPDVPWLAGLQDCDKG